MDLGKSFKQAVSGAQNELDKAARGAKGELNKLSGKSKKGGGKGAGGGVGVGKVSTPSLKGLDFSKMYSPNLNLDLTKIKPPTIKAPEVDLPKNNVPTLSAAPSINLNQDFNVGKALETNLNQAADQISAERDRAVQMDLKKMAEEEGQRGIDAAVTNIQTAGNDLKKMGGDILKFLTGSGTVEGIKPGIQNTNSGDNGPTAAYGRYGSGKGKSGRGGSKSGSLRSETSQKQQLSKSSLYARRKNK